MRFTTDGLIIRETNVGDYDRAVSILTRDRGVISAFVTGARRRNNRNQAATALLTYSNFTVFSNRDTYKIDDSSCIEVFFDIRCDIEKMALSQYFCELCTAMVPEDTDSSDFLRLVLNSLHFICKGDSNVNLIKAITELRMLILAGYMPDLIACNVCGQFEKFPMYFDPLHALVYCPEHRTAGHLLELDKTTFASMRHITFSELNRLFQFKVPPEAAKYLSFVTETYLLTQLERSFRTLDFFHSLELNIFNIATPKEDKTDNEQS